MTAAGRKFPVLVDGEVRILDSQACSSWTFFPALPQTSPLFVFSVPRFPRRRILFKLDGFIKSPSAALSSSFPRVREGRLAAYFYVCFVRFIP
jgi:hypothetical protein